MNASAAASAEEQTVDVYGERVQVPELGEWLRAIDEQGYVVIPDWLDAERTRRLRDDLKREINPVRELLPPDRTTVRAHNLLGKTRCVDDLVCDLRMLALVQGVLKDRVQVSAAVLFDLLPGCKPQPLHQDDSIWPIPRPHRPFLFNTVIAAEDFTKANGATHLVPGSHLWHDQPLRQPPDVETVQIEMKAGSLVGWTGAMWHGGGENTTDESRMAVNPELQPRLPAPAGEPVHRRAERGSGEDAAPPAARARLPGAAIRRPARAWWTCAIPC